MNLMNNASKFSFELTKTVGKARAGMMNTPHGQVPTPVFMPVGTQATVKALDSTDLATLDAAIILANTYHLYLRPGTDRLQTASGLHHFMNWSGPILTDSGGFQVFSLGKDQVKIKEDGVQFKSYLDGSRHFFSPESAIETQRLIGADIIMAFDECTPDQATASYARQALDRTHRWARQCFEYWESQQRLSQYGRYQALFGIIQGAMVEPLRRESARFMVDLPFDGLAVGGETIGYNMAGTVTVMDWIEAELPPDKPRYAMGLGLDPDNLLQAVAAGFDMFDCVAPTRLARNGALYFGEVDGTPLNWQFQSPYPKGRLSIGRQEFATDPTVIQPGCDCYTCQAGYSRAYLHHLYKAAELSYYRLASIHNVRFMVRLAQELRQRILAE